MHPQTTCVPLLNAIEPILEKMATLLKLVPALDDAGTPRDELIIFLFIVREFQEELSSMIEAYTHPAPMEIEEGGR